MGDLPVVAAGLTVGTFKFIGDGTFVSLVAATTNALNGALLARRPDHYENFTYVGILLMALIGGLAGGVARDLIVGDPPAPFINPAYVVLCLAAGVIGYALAYDSGQLFREGLFQFMTSFSLPWYAIVGAKAGVEHDFPLLGALMLAVIGPTTGRYLIDISCGVPPKHFVQGEWFVGTAVLTGAAWLALDGVGASTTVSTLGAFLIGFGFRVAALYRGWEEPLASVPEGVVVHADGRPLLGRKIAGKSRRELRELGLLSERDGDDRRGPRPGS